MKQPAKLVVAVFLAAAAGWAQQAGPMRTPTAPPIIHRIPLYPHVPPPPMAPAQIVQRFTANETKYKKAYKSYGFLQTIRVEEMNSQGGVTGSLQVKAEVYVKPGKGRYERILGSSKSSLQYLRLSSHDVEAISEIPPFPLAGATSATYNFTYRGTEKEGELKTYAFQVEPKVVLPGHIYFSGVVWVDTVDVAIVKSYGHFVSSGPKSPNALPFSFFDTYRENVAGKYWFPSYIRSDDYYHQGNNELPIRLVVESHDFRPGKPSISSAKTK